MYKAIVADDERKVRSIILKKGEWEQIGIRIIGEAQDGDQLCEMIERMKPDVVITDMRMPGINGAKLIKKLYDDYPEIKVIIISGFDDFEYMKQAINTKVVDYILKPVDSEGLNGALRKVVKEIEEQKSRQEEGLYLKIKLNESRPLLHENMLNRFVAGVEIKYEEFLECLELSNEFEIPYTYVMAIIRIENFNEICMSKYDGNAELLTFSAVNIVDELCSGNGKAFRNSRNKGEILIAFYHGENRVNIFSMVERIMSKLDELLQLKIFAGIGRAYAKYKDLILSLNEARVALLQINILGKKRIVCYEDIQTLSSNVSFQTLKNEDVFLTAIENANIPLIKDIIEKYYDRLSSVEYISVRDVQKMNSEVVSILESLIENTEEKPEFLNELSKLKRFIDNEIDLNSIKHILQDFAKNVSGYINEKKEKKEKSIIYEIKSYIERNYTSDLSLNDLASNYYWSKQYISKMFKEEFGVNLFEYINQLRIEKAKALLLEGELKSVEIVNLLGFNDESHFSKAFKKSVGVSPKGFKEKYQK